MTTDTGCRFHHVHAFAYSANLGNRPRLCLPWPDTFRTGRESDVFAIADPLAQAFVAMPAAKVVSVGIAYFALLYFVTAAFT